MQESNLDPLALTLFDIGAVRLGRFTLHSGKVSPIYVDLRLLVSFPAALRRVAGTYTYLLSELSFDVLAAYPYAALPIGTAIALQSGRPLIYPRKEAKGHGTGKRVEGVWQEGQTAIVIEDLVTTGDSILRAAAVLREAGLQVGEAVVLIDRQQGGRAALAAQGIRLHAVLTLSRLLESLLAHDRISPRQRDEVLNTLQI
jgi:uridine monophosphate synthetase